MTFATSFILLPVGGVHGGEGDSDPGGAKEGDGELGDVGHDHAEHVALLGAHAQQRGAELLRHVVRHVVRVLAARHAANLEGKGKEEENYGILN